MRKKEKNEIEKCLVVEASLKCQCSFCKRLREYNKIIAGMIRMGLKGESLNNYDKYNSSRNAV
jgi:hypothetical protein